MALDAGRIAKQINEAGAWDGWQTDVPSGCLIVLLLIFDWPTISGTGCAFRGNPSVFDGLRNQHRSRRSGHSYLPQNLYTTCITLLQGTTTKVHYTSQYDKADIVAATVKLPPRAAATQPDRDNYDYANIGKVGRRTRLALAPRKMNIAWKRYPVYSRPRANLPQRRHRTRESSRTRWRGWTMEKLLEPRVCQRARRARVMPLVNPNGWLYW